MLVGPSHREVLSMPDLQDSFLLDQLKEGPQTAGELCHNLQVGTAKLYEMLARLQDEDLVVSAKEVVYPHRVIFKLKDG